MTLVADRPETLPRLASAPIARPRLASVDIVRGLVMVVMALDHARDFFSLQSVQGDPERLADPGLALFFTRWVTHFCAPTFVFLAGVGAFLSLGRGRDRAALSRFLVTRGLWLVVCEFTLVNIGWTFRPDLTFVVAQVIWALGISMIVLAALLWLPRWAVAAVGVAMIVGHNALAGVDAALVGQAQAWALDGAHAAPLDAMGRLWSVVHVPRLVSFGFTTVLVRYPLIPWVGVMAAGYAFGPVLRLADAERRRTLLRVGLALLVGFVLLRASNVYGNPEPWSVKDSAANTLISFVNVEKYPPSLLFLMLTLGTGLLLLRAAERWTGPLASALETFGRVPMFYYLLHVPLIHLLAVGVGLAMYGPAALSIGLESAPAGWGFGLVVVYLVWMVVVVALYPVCRWYAGVKARRRDLTVLSYL